MAQEDTELRDLVMEALEKNGSLAKIRALLRANIFLAFDDEGGNLNHNETLDLMLKSPEGLLCLTIVHEFLEYCKLKNTLFVYMAETRQGKAYNYDGKNMYSQSRDIKQPILLTILKNFKSKELQKRKSYEQGDSSTGNGNKFSCNQFLAEQNCTYTVEQELSDGSNNNSQSDNSNDEKNKLHLHLPLDNSDTDTSSDSARNKSMSSEYIANQHILDNHNGSEDEKSNESHKSNDSNIKESIKDQDIQSTVQNCQYSSDSTSYLELKPAETCDRTGIQNFVQKQSHLLTNLNTNNHKNQQGQDSVSSSFSNVTYLPSQQDISVNEHNDVQHYGNYSKIHENTISDYETPEYSYDFTLTPSVKKVNCDLSPNLNVKYDNSSNSSVSISDVTDLIDGSESVSSPKKRIKYKDSSTECKDTNKNSQLHLSSNDSDISLESPIPSLSNLSFDMHSE